MDFTLYAWRFRFQAPGGIRFPAGKAGNTFRGALGATFRQVACLPSCHGAADCERRRECAYARLFEPRLEGGPSGLADAPRPFVIRAAALDGRVFPPGASFSIDVHIFDFRAPALEYFRLSFAQLAREGLGADRAPAVLEGVEPVGASPLTLSLLPRAEPAGRVAVEFTTPTELKAAGCVAAEPAFPILFGRIRDRIATLRALYGEGPLDGDFRGMAERAARVRLARSCLRWEHAQRRSSRTGQVHPLGGFVGRAEYEGDLAEFLPWLEAACWTGVGRQTVWGKGALRITS
jgi:hypothetical protein